MFREAFSKSLFRHNKITKNNLSFRVTGEPVLTSLTMCQNSFEIKQEFQDSTHRKTSQNPNENYPSCSPSTKKDIVQDTESYPQMCWTCPLPKDHTKCSERLKWPEVPLAFWAARYDCARKAYIFPQLPTPQDLNYWSNTFPQHSKILFQVIIQKLGRQKLVHGEMKPWSKKEQRNGFQ